MKTFEKINKEAKILNKYIYSTVCYTKKGKYSFS